MGRTISKWSMVYGVALLITGCFQKPVSTPPPKQPALPDAGGLLLADLPDAADAPVGTPAVALQSEVTAVTVYSDRAQVTRRATAVVTDQPKIFAFKKLPGWVDDGSVQVSAGAGRIVDVRVERNFLATPTDARYRKAETALKTVENQLLAVNDEIAVLDAQKAQIEAIKAFSLDKITKDTTIGNISVKSYGDVLTFISESLRKTAGARREAQLQLDAVTPKVDAARRTLEEMKSLLSLEETTVLVTLQSARPIESVIDVTYMMPGATWEPMHELRASTSGSNEVEVISFAVVSQTSGEDWSKAALSFSTQSTVDSVRIPELEALTLGDTHTAKRMLTSRMSSFSRAQQAYQGQNQLWNQVHQKAFNTNERASFEQVYQSNMEYLQVVQSKTVQIFETLKNRGTTAHFKAASAQPVRGDGYPTRIRIGYSTLNAKQKIVAVPEQSLNATRILEMVNATGSPLLPGKASLYQDGTFIGLTDIDFIAQSEKFSVFLGVADHLKLARTLDRKQSSLIHKTVNKMIVTFIVTVENLLDAETTLTLADRIPVSEDKEIRVSKVKIIPAVEPDSKGILRWDLKLKPKEKRDFAISYQVEYPQDLIIETRRKHAERMNMPEPTNNALPQDLNTNEIEMQTNRPYPSPAIVEMPEKSDIQDQLMNLEEML